MRGIRRKTRTDTQAATGQAGGDDHGQDADSRDADSRDEQGTPWTVLELPASYRRGRQAARMTIAACLLVLAGLGTWRAIRPLPAVPAASATTQPSLDTTAAGPVAERAAASWLVLDTVEDRQNRLSLVWDEPGRAGWDGQGAITVADTTVIAVTDTSPATADVTVAVNIQADDQTQAWVAVKVPIQIAGGAASVSGEPTLVGMPDPAPTIPAETIGQDDASLAEQTRPALDRFVTAWAAGDTQSAAAPGSTIPALPAGLADARVVDWKVRPGTGPTRTGQARIALTIGQATLTSTYNVTITQVTSNTSTRWQISHIN